MNKLRRLVARLRRECPWDRKQTVFSFQHSVLEEAYELAEAIRERDYRKMKEEAGDYIFVGLFVAQVLEDTGRTTVGEILDGIAEKLVRRHPHIFGTVKVKDAEEVIHNWNKIKAEEKRRQVERKTGMSILSGVPKALPALQRATSIQMRAKRVGFDWKDPRDVLGKVIEEVEEIRTELRGRDGRVHKARVREELGDLLFALANMSRHLHIDAEDALQRAATKFTRRFRAMEKSLSARGRKLEDCTLEEMDRVWDEHKRKARRRRQR